MHIFITRRLKEVGRMYYYQQQPEQFRDSNYFKKNEVGNTSSEDVTQLNPWSSYAYAKNIMYSYGYNDFNKEIYIILPLWFIVSFHFKNNQTTKQVNNSIWTNRKQVKFCFYLPIGLIV